MGFTARLLGTSVNHGKCVGEVEGVSLFTFQCCGHPTFFSTNIYLGHSPPVATDFLSCCCTSLPCPPQRALPLFLPIQNFQKRNKGLFCSWSTVLKYLSFSHLKQIFIEYLLWNVYSGQECTGHPDRAGQLVCRQSLPCSTCVYTPVFVEGHALATVGMCK